MDPAFDPARPEEPLRILSDLHLGHPASRARQVNRLRPLLEGARTIVFNGDTSEERKKAFRESGDALKADLVRLCAEVGAKPVFLSGNHDPITPTIHHLDLYGGKVFVTHGDVFYPDVSPWSRFHKQCVEIMHRLRADYTEEQLENFELLLEINKRISREIKPRLPGAKPGLLALAQTLWNEAWPPDRPFRILHTWATAKKTAHAFVSQHRPDARLTVVGHTHRRFVSARNGRTIVNTGAMMAFAKSSLVEIKDGTATVSGLDFSGEVARREDKPLLTLAL